ncbi:MAG: 4Fe-4S dicluster domain-containing protein [Verrucomicrobia bacterium]|nr:4Fe-4S dicluster domain-containing protein [Verrucomicrobiota bacterium]
MSFYCTPEQFEQLIESVKNAGYKLLGPKLRDQVIIYDELQSAKDLPIGWTDEQDPGRYRLKPRGDKAYFGYNLGPDSWKKFLFPSREKLYSLSKQNGKLSILQEAPAVEKMAFIGVRACEIQAIVVLDKVFNTKLAVYEQYQRRRESTFIMAVNCTTVVNTCFCASMQAGPHVRAGFDLSLTEVIDENRHYFLLQIGSKRGEEICEGMKMRPATEVERRLGAEHVERTVEQMIRKVDNAHVHDLLENSHDYKRWDEVATRCVNCANCTNACPTCFCSDTEDIVSLDGAHVDRWQSWESCFNLSHSYIHGGSVRNSAQSRYRQWLTHKFGTWWDQFGVSGCVGCGRCITWCPVGIDVTEELRELKREHDQKNR